MVKALIKKELLQFLSIYTIDKRKGRSRSVGVTVLLLILMGYALVSFAGMFFMMYSSIAPAVAETNENRLLFAIAGALTIAVSILGSAFTTYSVLYKAKDNELLLSLPIPPAKILSVRVLTVFVLSLVSCVIAWTPSLIAYFIFIGFSPAVLVGHFIMTFALAAFASVISSVLGWLIALVTGFVRNKSLVTVLLSVGFIAVYYGFYFRMQSILRSVIANMDRIAEAMHGWAWPLMQVGRAASGEILPLAAITLIAAALFILMYVVLSKTLFGVLTASGKVKKAVYREKEAKAGTAAGALLKRELMHFVSSPVLILNTGFGVLVVVVGAVAAVIKADALKDLLNGSSMPFFITAAAGVLPAAAVSMVMIMDCFTASSVSLEGKHIWLVQSTPVPAKLVLRMKELTHVLLNAVPGAVAAAVISYVLRASLAEAMLSALLAAIFVWLTAAFGLMMNLLKPNLEWTNESVPVKQGLPVLFTMLFGFGSLLALAGLLIGLSLTVGTIPALAVGCAVFALPAVLIDLWIGSRGAERFRHIS